MPPTRPPADPRLQAFRDEVRAILALSGGINAVSMGKIRHRGQAAGFEPEEVDALVANLRAGEQVEPKNLVAFRQTIRAVLKKARLKPGDLLTPRLAGKLEETGVTRYKLTRSDAAQEVREQARELDLKRLSPEVAIETFRQQVRAARDAGPLTPARMKVLRKFAATLGVDDDRFDSLVREEVRTALAHPVEIRRANGRFLASVISAAVFAVLGFFLLMSFYRPRIVPPSNSSPGSKPLTTSSPAPAGVTPPAPNEEPEAAREPALTLARRVFTTPADEAILDGLSSNKEAERIGAMRSLLLRLDLHRETAEQSQALERLVSSALATDPSSSLVTMTLQGLHDRLNLFDANRSLSAGSIDSGFWTLDTLLEALVEPGLDQRRAEMLGREIDDASLGPVRSQGLLASGAKAATGEAHNIRSQYARSLYEKLAKDSARDASRATFRGGGKRPLRTSGRSSSR